jgi:hypothetical protein
VFALLSFGLLSASGADVPAAKPERVRSVYFAQSTQSSILDASLRRFKGEVPRVDATRQQRRQPAHASKHNAAIR